MSERVPDTAGPKPQPPKEIWEPALERLQKAFEPKPEMPTVSTEFVQSEPVSAEEEADAQLDVIESMPVGEVAFPADTEETPVAELATEPSPSAETTEQSEAPKSDSDADAVEQLEAAFAAPSSPESANEVPKRGELSHNDYHAQRPSEGVYRNGDKYRRTAGLEKPHGFATKQEYDKQTGVNDPTRATKHYDEVMGLNEKQPASPERPSYETMDTDTLVFAYAKAEMMGDKFVTDDIRNVYTLAMEETYTKPGSTISYEEHQEALARFDRMAGAAIEYEKAKDPEHSALVDAAVERANKEPSFGDRLKQRWAKGKETMKKMFRPEWWGERFTAATNKIGEAATWALNLGVNPEDTDQEKDKKRNRNRVIYIAGAAAVLVGSIAASYGLGFANGGGGGHHAADALNNGGTGSGQGAAGGNTISAHDQAVANALAPKNQQYSLEPVLSPNSIDTQTAADTAAAAGVAAAGAAAEKAQQVADAIPTGFNIGSGEGGLQLFSSLNIDPSKWANNANNLLTKFPQDFYRMSTGGVGIAHQGLLSPEARSAIEAIR